ncbi:hypothetical protein SAMN05446037_10481 [Anaerovirgula multivorans]|uniref:Uncharacterized protein n=1 Tax=Anaerovirgula multivorans TaxID=312168 RepID=A0A239KHM4_9FIRM|nr:hypothetical protein [Anaerovirgula multivorans]SNT17681.1 hypothetical protein SAMN05446037_10481 [Anaerovirgula multivorans]
MKKVVALICIISCVFTMFVSAFAAEQEEITLNALEERQGLKTVDEVPEGLEPIELEVEEADDLDEIKPYYTEYVSFGRIAVRETKTIKSLGFLKKGTLLQATNSAWTPSASDISVRFRGPGGTYGSGSTVSVRAWEDGYYYFEVLNWGPHTITDGGAEISY